MNNTIKISIASFVTGLIFSIGLGVSGMTMPQKVLGFLDLFGSFDPSLVFVMVGAIIFHFIAFKIVTKRKAPLLDEKWHVPTKKEITPSLVIGAYIFGFGWALGGMCPGPAVVRLAVFETNTVVFLISMLIGMFLFRKLDEILKLNK